MSTPNIPPKDGVRIDAHQATAKTRTSSGYGKLRRDGVRKDTS